MAAEVGIGEGVKMGVVGAALVEVGVLAMANALRRVWAIVYSILCIDKMVALIVAQ